MKQLRYSVIAFGTVAIMIQLVMMSRYGVTSLWGLAFVCTAVGYIKALREIINAE
jgi:hypothetical protein